MTAARIYVAGSRQKDGRSIQFLDPEVLSRTAEVKPMVERNHVIEFAEKHNAKVDRIFAHSTRF